MWMLIAHYSSANEIRIFFSMPGAFIGQTGHSDTSFWAAAMPLIAQCQPHCHVLGMQHRCLHAHKGWSTAFQWDRVPPAWAEEEPLGALVVTRAVGASQNPGEMHTRVSPSGSQRAVALCAQPLPSHCYLFQKFLKVLTNTDFIVLEVRIESKFWVLDIKAVVVWIA